MHSKISIGMLVFFCLSLSTCGKKNKSLIAITEITISPNQANVIEGESLQFTALEISSTGNILNNSSFKWDSNAPSIISIHPITGLATARAIGVAQITATSISGTRSSNATVGVVKATPGGVFTLSGKAEYEDPMDLNGHKISPPPSPLPVKPIRNAVVKVIAIDGFRELASSVTDDAGNFDFTIPIDNSGGGAGSYLRIVAQTDTTIPNRIEIRNNLSDNALLTLTSNAFDDSLAAIPPQNVLAPAASVGGAFNILDVFSKANELIENTALCPPSNPGPPCPLPPLTGYWEPGGSEGTFFSILSNQSSAIFICGGGAGDICASGDSDEYDDAVIAHEYGHFALAQFSHDDSPGGFHGISENGQDIRLSWSEGWANFFSSAVRSNPIYVDTSAATFFFDIEDPDSPLRPSAIYTTSELAVAGILWDILDGVADPATVDNDPLDLTFNEILQTVIDIPLSSQATMEAFWLAFEAARPVTEINDLQFILRDRQIELFPDQHEPDDASFPLLQPGIPQHHTLYRSGLNPTGDLDTIQFDVEQGTVYTLETLNLTSGTDTLLTIKDSMDNTLFIFDNQGGINYLGCGVIPFTGFSTCPLNGSPSLGSPEPLSSINTWTATATERLSVEVKRSTSAPPSAGQFGSYDIRLNIVP